jgi:hypothetical protein
MRSSRSVRPKTRMMTVEDAIERVLQGGAWVECPACLGEGTVRIEGGRGWDGCVPCEGFGSVVELDYLEACQLLGKDPPERDRGTLLQMATIGEAVMTGISPPGPPTMNISGLNGLSIDCNTLQPGEIVSLVYENSRWVREKKP